MSEMKEKIDKIIKKIEKDEKYKKKFLKDPVKAIEKEFGIDLPDKEINQIIDAVKAKLTFDNAKGLFDKAKEFLDKK